MMGSPNSLRRLFNNLRTYKILDWAASSGAAEQEKSRIEVGLSHADVVSSEWMTSRGRHTVVLDIDHPAWLVKSSTEGHYHLYVDVPDGIPWDKYRNLLVALAQCGVIEQGFCDASIRRGFSCARLPWIKKEIHNGQART